MLPPGIFIMGRSENGLAAMHPTWADDVAKYGPWGPDGDFVKGGRSCEASIVVAESCETTMELIRNFADSGELGEWGAVVCAEQTGGRGQLRRPWASIPGNLHVSIILPQPPEEGPWAEYMTHLQPLVAGYVICSVLDGAGVHLELKWPNDIFQGGRKVGGMLIEERNGLSVLGFGLNLAGCPSDSEMRVDHSAPAAKIAIPSWPGGPLTLLESLVNRGKNVYAAMLDEIPPTKFIAMVERRLAWMGRPIRVREGGEIPYEAVITGLSPKGGLVIRRGGEETVLFSGSIFPL